MNEPIQLQPWMAFTKRGTMAKGRMSSTEKKPIIAAPALHPQIRAVAALSFSISASYLTRYDAYHCFSAANALAASNVLLTSLDDVGEGGVQVNPHQGTKSVASSNPVPE